MPSSGGRASLQSSLPTVWFSEELCILEPFVLIVGSIQVYISVHQWCEVHSHSCVVITTISPQSSSPCQTKLPDLNVDSPSFTTAPGSSHSTFCLYLFSHGFSVQPQLFWNSHSIDQASLQTQRSACLCSPVSRIQGMDHYYLASTFCSYELEWKWNQTVFVSGFCRLAQCPQVVSH